MTAGFRWRDVLRLYPICQPRSAMELRPSPPFARLPRSGPLERPLTGAAGPLAGPEGVPGGIATARPWRGHLGHCGGRPAAGVCATVPQEFAAGIETRRAETMGSVASNESLVGVRRAAQWDVFWHWPSLVLKLGIHSHNRGTIPNNGYSFPRTGNKGKSFPPYIFLTEIYRQARNAMNAAIAALKPTTKPCAQVRSEGPALFLGLVSVQAGNTSSW